MKNKFQLLVVATLFLALVPQVQAACCFVESDALGCFDDFTGTREQCEGDEGGLFDDTQPGCDFFEACEKRCACIADKAEYLPKHFFATKFFDEDVDLATFRVDDPTSCTNTFCTGEPCKKLCQQNEGQCIGRAGAIDATEQHYCWDNNILYPTQSVCLDQCRETPPNCIENALVSATLNQQGATSCFCGSEEVEEEGFCCTGGKYFEGATRAMSCPTNGCEQGGNTCAKSCASAGETNFDFDVGDAANSENCPSTAPLCCSQQAFGYADCCNPTEACDDPFLFPHSDCRGTEDTPCKSVCQEPPDCNVGFKISDDINRNNEFTHCTCAGALKRVAAPAADQGFCCPSNTGPEYLDETNEGCGVKLTGTVEGTITNAADQTVIEGAIVQLKSNEVVVASVATAEDGTYEFASVEYAMYGVVAGANGFESSTATFSLEASSTIQDISLTPLTDEDCNSLTPPSPTVTIAPLQGKREAVLAWTACNNADFFLLQRLGPNNEQHPLGTIITSANGYTDTTVEWSKTYDYTIKAHHTTGTMSEPETATIVMGKAICEGIFDTTLELCQPAPSNPDGPNTHTYTCTISNTLQFEDNCDTGRFCTGPDTQGETECKQVASCEETPGHKPFGLFYKKDTCEQVGSLQRYCYQDFTQTTIDACKDCGEKTCYDYLSESACYQDQCGAGATITAPGSVNEGCAYISLWAEFGKGLCYDPDFTGKKCDQCTQQAGVFHNTQCSQDVCSALGSCFAQAASCNDCTPTTTCEDFTTEDACTSAGVNTDTSFFDFTGSDGINKLSPYTPIPSNDPCKLGRCRWQAPTEAIPGKCIKDGDSNEINDCPDIEGEEQSACKIDNEGPTTTIDKQADGEIIINEDGKDIIFTSSEDAVTLFYCISTQPCDPDQELFFDENQEATLDPTKEPNNLQGTETYFLAFYAQDKHENVEQVNVEQIAIDTDKPEVTVISFSQPLDTTPKTSTVTLTAESTEVITCTLDIPAPLQAKVTTNDFATAGKKKFTFIASQVEDNAFPTTVTCLDSAGNEFTKSLKVRADAIAEIISVSPDFETVTTSSVPLEVQTTDPAECTLTEITSKEEIVLDAEQLSVNEFKHTATKTLSSDSTLHYQVICRDPNSKLEIDREFIMFTRDTTKPTIKITKAGAPFDTTKYHRSPFVLEFECDDIGTNPLGDAPGEFGCDKDDLSYCVGSLAECSLEKHPESPDSVQVSQLSAFNLQVSAADKGGNTQTTPRFKIKIDNTAPTINVAPIPGIVDGRNARIPVTAAFEDNPGGSGIQSLTLQTINGADLSQRKPLVTLTPAEIAAGAITNKQLDLFPGTNLIVITANDAAGNTREFSKVLLRDVFGPVINPAVADHERVKVDSNQFIPNGGERKDASFFRDVLFGAYLIDDSRIGQTPEDNQVTITCKQGTTCSKQNFSQTINLVFNGSAYTGKREQFDATGNFTATFKATDEFTNTRIIPLDFSVADTTKPTAVISITADDEEVAEVGINQHKLVITPSEPLTTITAALSYPSAISDNPTTIAGTPAKEPNGDYTLLFDIKSEEERNQNIKGVFTIVIEATDANGNTNTIVDTTFNINTQGPDNLNILTEIKDTVFQKDLFIKGFVEEGSTVSFTVVPCNSQTECEFIKTKTVSTTSQPEQTPDGLDNKKIRAHFFGGLPQEGSTSIFFDGEDLLDGFPTGIRYADFEPRNASTIPRYKLGTPRFSVAQGNGAIPKFTEFVLETPLIFQPGLIKTLTGSYKMSTYREPFPPKYFQTDTPLQLTPGLNFLVIVAEKEGRRSKRVRKFITYDPSKLIIELEKPEEKLYTFADFDNAGSKVAFSVKTLRGTAPEPSTCTFSHVKDDVADTFGETAMTTTNNNIHTAILDATDCKDQGGSFCSIGNNAQKPTSYHIYEVTCTPANTGLQPEKRTICFQTATFAKTSSQTFGENLCSGTCGAKRTSLPIECKVPAISNSGDDDDGDGISDGQDNCPLAANQDQQDSDGDGLGNACDDDDDGDGITDGQDNCPLAANQDQADDDDDGIGKECDADDNEDNTADDTDSDAIKDPMDNCPTVPNNDQADLDTDRIGNACDDDDDGDGISDGQDNCPLAANQDQADEDNDNMGDACDPTDDSPPDGGQATGIVIVKT